MPPGSSAKAPEWGFFIQPFWGDYGQHSQVNEKGAPRRPFRLVRVSARSGQHAHRVFQVVHDGLQELRPERAVDHAVID
ncbi:hypothetical protein FOB51_07215 [Paracoccus yeei]|uniref:Uncharacterized protein n=1 Tax=Paracoccus yeei TaxID=147645 RepID=A0A5P2QP56_9RHOB|nr:hypothetical protein FOB51_07215 [Paracoccus yeei]